MDAKVETSVCDLNAVELRDRLARGALSSVDLVKACIARIDERDSEIDAWAWFDRDFAMKQAQAMDRYRHTGRPLGALHGLPVGLKDIIDTARVPTANGTEIDRDRIPSDDAAVVESLKAQGAVILGKTRSTELAYLHPSQTRNPVNPAHTPGGSSSGSAAAVAAGMVPVAIGTQTGGSVLRPAAFCGTVGYKPTFGAIPRRGILAQSQTLDTVGVFAKTVEDAAMLAEVLFAHDAADPATSPSPSPQLLQQARSEPPVKPTFAFVRTPYWERADDQTRAAFEELTEMLGEQCFEAELPTIFAEALTIRERINLAEMAKNYHHYSAKGHDRLSETMAAAIEKGNAILARDYIAALDWPRVLNSALDELFSRCDAILTPSAPGPAPANLETTGDACFNGLWTLCGTPAITLPVFEADDGLPMGVQLVGRRHADGRLLRSARWFVDCIANAN